MEEIKGCEQRNLEHFNRLIIHLDMDAYYAQVEMKQHNIDLTKPVAVLQWNSIIALNYVAKKAGVKRGMNCFEALEVRNDMIFVHVATIVINQQTAKSEEDTSQQMIFDYDDYGTDKKPQKNDDDPIGIQN